MPESPDPHANPVYTVAFITKQQHANCERAHQLALKGQPLPRAEWEALDIGGSPDGFRLAHLGNAIRHCIGPFGGPIQPEWATEYNELTARMLAE